jgi:hypothetical protein
MQNGTFVCTPQAEEPTAEFTFQHPLGRLWTTDLRPSNNSPIFLQCGASDVQEFLLAYLNNVHNSGGSERHFTIAHWCDSICNIFQEAELSCTLGKKDKGVG